MNSYTKWAKGMIMATWGTWVHRREVAGPITHEEFHMALSTLSIKRSFPVNTERAFWNIVENAGYVARALCKNKHRWSNDKKYYPGLLNKIILIDNIARQYAIQTMIPKMSAIYVGEGNNK